MFRAGRNDSGEENVPLDLTRGNAGGAGPGAGAGRGGARAAGRGPGRAARAGPAGCGSPARGRLPDPSPFPGCPLPSPRALLRGLGRCECRGDPRGTRRRRPPSGLPGSGSWCRRVPARPEPGGGGCYFGCGEDVGGESDHILPSRPPSRSGTCSVLAARPPVFLLAHRHGDPRGAIAARRPRSAAALPPPGRAAPSPRPQVHCLPSAAAAGLLTPWALREPGLYF